MFLALSESTDVHHHAQLFSCWDGVSQSLFLAQSETWNHNPLLSLPTK
jgi:hypothetical protein